MSTPPVVEKDASEVAGTATEPSLHVFDQSQQDLKDSSFGVRSLADTMPSSSSEVLTSVILGTRTIEDSARRGASSMDLDRSRDLPGSTATDNPESISRPTARTASTTAPKDSSSSSDLPCRRARPMPHLITPLLTPSPAPSSSALSSPKSVSMRSFHHSDADSMIDDGCSQAITSSEGEEENEPPSEVLDSAPQLIMPSIKMPSRRPFTERGKSMGRLKVLFAGESGSGKTSLIKSIVQICEDIVHVDPLSPSVPNLETVAPKPGRRKGKMVHHTATTQTTEVYASTKPYPAWWSEVDETKVLRRRKSMGDSVLERNICFVDTPGYRQGASVIDSVEPVVKYVEEHFERMGSLMNMSDGDLMGLLSGAGGFQVDGVFYLISQRIKPEDIDYIKRLAPLTNIIPIITHADRLDEEETSTLKLAVMNELQTAGIRPFLCEQTGDHGHRIPDTRPPFAVSSATSNGADNMDASLLMSPDYVQPLATSELNTLVDRVFERDTVAWLRHCAAKKFVQWWRGSLSASIATPSPGLSSSISSSAYALVSASGGSSAMLPSSRSPSSRGPLSPGQTTSYALARIADHTQREDRMAQVRLAKWASDLQRSLQNERERFEKLARGERAMWLTGRLEECILDGQVESHALEHNLLSNPRTSTSLISQASILKFTGGGGSCLRAVVDPQDPLGLLRLKEELRTKGWVGLQVVGSFGLLGGLAVWIAQRWITDTSGFPDWDWTWLGLSEG